MVARDERIPRIEVWNMDSFARTLGDFGVQNNVPVGMDRVGYIAAAPLSGIPIYESLLLPVGRVRIVTVEGDRIIRVAVR